MVVSIMELEVLCFVIFVLLFSAFGLLPICGLVFIVQDSLGSVSLFSAAGRVAGGLYARGETGMLVERG
jgi:hypothetical protein